MLLIHHWPEVKTIVDHEHTRSLVMNKMNLSALMALLIIALLIGTADVAQAAIPLSASTLNDATAIAYTDNMTPIPAGWPDPIDDGFVLTGWPDPIDD